MSAQSAKVVSLDAFRNARNAQQSARMPEALPMMPGLPAMAWVPVWFVPVFWTGTPSTLN